MATFSRLQKLICILVVLGELSTGSSNMKDASPLVGSIDPSKKINILTFKAKGDGHSDDTKAFQDAWAQVCQKGKKRTSSPPSTNTLIVPAPHRFVVGPIKFPGPCGNGIRVVIQVDGIIVASPSLKGVYRGIDSWIKFTNVSNVTFQGAGTIDGAISDWGGSPLKATALTFLKSHDVSVNGITIQNSPRIHLKFNYCERVTATRVNISSPGNSRNTDGIHLGESRHVTIQDSHIACGDDCISIQNKSSDVYIHDVYCGPSHGISVGALGRGNSTGCVSDISVKDVVIHNSINGVRIKTWQGGLGLVRNVTFSNITVDMVKNPVVIEQYYYDDHNYKTVHKNQTSAVAIMDVKFDGVKGSYTNEAVKLACSDSVPCTDLKLTNIRLNPVQPNKARPTVCWRAFGSFDPTNAPPLNCSTYEGPKKGGPRTDLCPRCTSSSTITSSSYFFFFFLCIVFTSLSNVYVIEYVYVCVMNFIRGVSRVSFSPLGAH